MAPSYNNCQEDPKFGEAPNYPVRISAINDSAELVKIHNISNTPVDLTGWRLCSVRGNQLHGTLSGSLAPGEERDIPSQAVGNIWNNNGNDPGALYDANGSLVSYWPD